MSRTPYAAAVVFLPLLFSIRGSAQTVPAAKHFEQYVVYWTTEPGWRTELQLRNNLESSDLTVAPAVRTADGVETALPAVIIKSGDVVSLDLYDSLLKAAPQLAGSWGSLVLRYSAEVRRAMYAAVMVKAVGQPIAFHLDASVRRPAYDAGSREGIWWLPRETVTGYLILSNAGDQTLNPNLMLYDSSGKAWQQKLSLNARVTKRLAIRSLLQQSALTGSYGGVRIEMSQGAGSLARFRALAVRRDQRLFGGDEDVLPRSWRNAGLPKFWRRKGVDHARSHARPRRSRPLSRFPRWNNPATQASGAQRLRQELHRPPAFQLALGDGQWKDRSHQLTLHSQSDADDRRIRPASAKAPARRRSLGRSDPQRPGSAR
jgi:hypothetical protein